MDDIMWQTIILSIGFSFPIISIILMVNGYKESIRR